jgi:hypothetical protein
MVAFNGLGMNLGNLSRLSNAQTRSISPENLTGEKGRGGMALEGMGKAAAASLGRGWKISPSLEIQPGETLTLADIAGPGAIQQVWMTLSGSWRFTILRIYWDDQEVPSVECPAGDFFACGWSVYTQISSIAVCVNPGSGFNCYWEMPFQRRCRITMANLASEKTVIYYQINYTLTDVPGELGYFHAQFRRTNPLPLNQVFTVLDGVQGIGHYVGTGLAWGVNNNGWWGEGEIKFYLDGDQEDPTICGTGTEDYIGGSYAFVNKPTGIYQEFTTPYTGFYQAVQPDGNFCSQTRFGMYRWHIADPIRFQEDIRVTIQALGWRSGGRYLALQDDIASVAYWYQALPTASFPILPGRDQLEII